MKKVIIILTVITLIYSCSSNSNNSDYSDAYTKRVSSTANRLVSGNYIDIDSLNSIFAYYSTLITDEEKEAYTIELENALKVPPIPKMTMDEYYNYFNTKLETIKLEKLFEQAFLYGKYADGLAELMAEMDNENKMYSILTDPKIKELYDNIDSKNKTALDNYLKYGEPKEDFIYIQSACTAILPSILKDPSYEIIKDKYYLKQTKTGYDYKLLIKAKNSFGVFTQQEITFSLEYNATDKLYSVTKTNI